MVWTGTVCFWNGKRSPLAHCVCDCDSESSRGCLLSFIRLRVSCRRCRSCQSVNNIPKYTILLPLCFYSQSLKPASADTPSRFTPLPLPFLIIIFCVFGSLAFSHPQHISLLELANSSNGSCNRRSASAAPCTCRNNK